tara:strand:+ start:1000 stop:1731 length:732 start_codon:yes stop_codon:yes gene_type:complete
MKKLILIFALSVFACSSDLFAQDYMKMSKKQLRIEHLKKINLTDSLSEELSLSSKKSQNLQSDLNNTSNDLILTSDSLKNSNLEITQLEAELIISKNELSKLGSELNNLVKQNSEKTNLIADKAKLIEFSNASAKFVVPDGKTWIIHNVISDYVTNLRKDSYGTFFTDEIRIFIKSLNGVSKTNITRRIFGPLLHRTTGFFGHRFPVVFPEKTTFELITFQGDLESLKKYNGKSYLSLVESSN